MSKLLQIRNVPDSVHRTLKVRAAQAGLTLSDYVLRELVLVAERPTLEELLGRIDDVIPFAPLSSEAIRAIWERELRRKLMPYVEGGRTEAWIAEDSTGSFLGYLLLGGGGGFLTPEPHGFIFDVWVTPEHRGKGIGKFLVEWAVNWARSKGYRKIKLEVAEGNDRARHVYEELGFRSERRYLGKVLE